MGGLNHSILWKVLSLFSTPSIPNSFPFPEHTQNITCISTLQYLTPFGQQNMIWNGINQLLCTAWKLFRDPLQFTMIGVRDGNFYWKGWFPEALNPHQIVTGYAFLLLLMGNNNSDCHCICMFSILQNNYEN